MTQRDKLLEKIRSHPKDVRFDDLQTLLGYYGYQLVRVSGSHHRYQRQGSPPVTISRHGAQVHSAAVEEVLRILDTLTGNDETR
jgi:predicted RNA binding protein YcfA (HicA-like mRNA interferase family)